jgi:hypothetical protein
MLVTREQLVQRIATIVRETANLHQLRLARSGIRALTNIPSPWNAQSVIDIDEDELHQAIEELMLAARGAQFLIDDDAIEGAKRTVKCHYLWFC